MDWYFLQAPYDKKVFIKDIKDFPPHVVSFVYIITNKKTGQYYIGKKSLYLNKKKKLTKIELLEYEGKRGRKPKTKKITSESDWKSYYSSNEQLKGDVIKLGENNFDRKILEFCTTKKLATYYEVYHQFRTECLKDPLSYNSNILGSFYRKDLV